VSVVARRHSAPPPESTPESTDLGASLAEIYSQHSALVFRGLRRLGVPEACLDDAVQDVFLIVHRRGNDFEGRSSLSTWLYGIVVRVAKDYRRSRARHAKRVELLECSLRGELLTSESPADEAERRQANQVLHALLDSLSDEQRELLVLAVLEQLPVKEVAGVLGVRVRTCQRRLQAAHAAFERALAKFMAKDGRRA
jgi:RNA polymerase sigma-70 factor, ECF subfamily